MAIYTTFFLCDPKELLSGFPSWREPLDAPRRREVKNPFTGKTMIIETREPDWPEGDNLPERHYQVTAIGGSYEAYLASRLPLFVQQHPHWPAKGLTPIELEPLLEILGITQPIETALYSPPASGDCLEVFPNEFLTKLPSLDLKTTSASWAAALSTPDYTHSVSGLEVSEGWTANEATEILSSIVTLGCKLQSSFERLYLLTEI